MNQLDMVVLNDNGEKTAKLGDEILYLPCLGKICVKEFSEKTGLKANNNIIVKKVFGETQNVVCPHCGQKLKVRCYKNGNVKLEIR